MKKLLILINLIQLDPITDTETDTHLMKKPLIFK
jgi:hypothetical protein